MKKLKYIFCDLDGTLLNDDKVISPEQVSYIRELKKRKGVRFGFASGRTLNSLIPLAKEMEILDVCDVIVANNGVDVYDVARNETEQNHLIPVTTVQKIVHMMESYKDILNVIVHSRNELYGMEKTRRIDRVLRINHYDQSQYHSIYDGGYDSVARVSLLFEEERYPEVRAVVEATEFPDGVQAFQSDVDIYDLVREGVSKARGIERYVSRQGDTLEQVIAFGDSGNDRRMLEEAGVSVAMKNGIKEICDIADYTTSRTNNENGIKEFLITVEDWF